MEFARFAASTVSAGHPQRRLHPAAAPARQTPRIERRPRLQVRLALEDLPIRLPELLHDHVLLRRGNDMRQARQSCRMVRRDCLPPPVPNRSSSLPRSIDRSRSIWPRGLAEAASRRSRESRRRKSSFSTGVFELIGPLSGFARFTRQYACALQLPLCRFCLPVLLGALFTFRRDSTLKSSCFNKIAGITRTSVLGR